MANKKYCLEITFIQSTDGEPDDTVVLNEFSSDPVIHAIKTQVMTRHLTTAINNMTKEFTDAAISMGGETLPVPGDGPGKPDKK